MRLSPRVRRILVAEVGKQLSDERSDAGNVDEILRKNRLAGTARIQAG